MIHCYFMSLSPQSLTYLNENEKQLYFQIVFISVLFGWSLFPHNSTTLIYHQIILGTKLCQSAPAFLSF